MDMPSREQYLAALREEYLGGDKNQKTRLLNEARKRTRLNRKVLIRKLAHVPAAAGKPKRRLRRARYGAELKAPLARVWELFDFPCGQRLAPVLREQTERLRAGDRLKCSREAAALLREMSSKTIDRLLARERAVRCLQQHRRPPGQGPITEHGSLETGAQSEIAAKTARSCRVILRKPPPAYGTVQAPTWVQPACSPSQSCT
jgi:hypothetical protein